MDLAGLGVRPYWAGCGRDLEFYYYDPYGTLYDGEPLQSWTRPDEQTVSVWNAVDKEPGVDGVPIVYLIFHFGEWTVRLFDFGGSAAMSDAERRACAMGLSGSITKEGWIIMSGSSEIELGGDEPELEFGGLGRKQPFVLFFPGPCEPESDQNEELPSIGGVPISLTKDFASWCHPGEMMRIHVYFTASRPSLNNSLGISTSATSAWRREKRERIEHPPRGSTILFRADFAPRTHIAVRPPNSGSKDRR